MRLRSASLSAFGLGLGLVLAAGSALAQPRTLEDALAAAYSGNPTLQTERATLRGVDENVPAALAGWRPTVVFSGSGGYAWGNIVQTEPTGFGGPNNYKTTRADRDVATATGTVTQNIYRGGRTRASTNRAENQVMSERAKLVATEEQVFSDTINAFVTVIQNRQLLELQRNNEIVLQRQLQATNDRFRVGEITRTDVAQAEAALAGAVAQRQAAEGNFANARATFERLIGYPPPDDLVPPQPLKLPVASKEQALQLAVSNNPNVVLAQFNQSAAKDAIDLAYSALMPTVSVQGSVFRTDNSSTIGYVTRGEQVLAQLSVPIYQGGAEYAAIRQARQQEQAARKQIDDARRTAQQAAAQAWETLIAARATIESTRSQIRANEIALDGTQREALLGSRTTLDVLNAEQTLLNSRVTLVQNLASLVTASYAIASSIGRLTARDLALKVNFYDETAYYNAVRNKLWGAGDYATDQPGR